MNNKRIVNNTLSMFLLIILFSIVLTGCSYDYASPQDSQISSIPSTATSNAPAAPAASTPAPSHSPFPEPSVKPTALPASAKWNPHDGSWYDSAWVELDPVTHRYKAATRTLPPGYTPPEGASITANEWIELHKDSKDEIDIAIMKYHQELRKYIEKQKKEDPDWMARSNIPIGGEEGEPLEILTDLGIPKLQGLLDRVDWKNPFVYYVEAAIERITRRTLTPGLGGWDYQVIAWKNDFSSKSSTAKSQVNEIIYSLAENQADDRFMQIRLGRLGILALPEVYELVINQGNTDLIKYLPDLLPLDKMKTYNIQAGQTDDATLKEALRNCAEDIKIIRALHVD
jgi:hypothetical protein